MKKITINLTAAERVNAVPLQQALEVYKQSVSDLAKHRHNFAALKKEVADFLENTNPADLKRLQIIQGKNFQLETFPGFITRCERQIGEQVVPTLARHADEFKAGLLRFYSTAHDATATQIAEVFRANFSDDVVAGDRRDRARSVALECDACRGVAARLHEAENIRWSDQPRSNRPQDYDRDLVAAAEQLLALAWKE